VTTPAPTGVRTGGFLKRLLVGRALASHKAEHQLLPKFLALPVFSSDPLSSVAYATEEMMLVLITAGTAALAYKMPLAIGIALLLIIVVTSYRQTVKAYPRGGGSYIVARENLGTVPGLVAAAAILTDYVLTVAVSITAGTVAITSAVPSLGEHRVLMAVALVLLVTLANLRGVKEAGTLFAVPTYGFVAIVGVTILIGLVECLDGTCPEAPTAHLPIEATTTISLFLLLRAFSSGATALTGVEAIADGVQAFRRPQARNAATTLALMATIAVSMFLGITLLAQLFHVRIDEEIAASHSVLSQIGETVYGRGLGFILLQTFTAGILILAANTAFQDFPRLSSILARDRFMPSQFRNRGDRLVFSNGVVVLAALACLLIWIFDAELTRLIQLYVVGVFTAFTLSQAGMVRRWFRVQGDRWRGRAVINGIGAATTGIVLVIVTVTKFRGGAWIVIVAIPIIVMLFLSVHHHYAIVSELLRARRLSGTARAETTFVLLVPDLGPATLEAIGYLRAVRPERLEAWFVGPPSLYRATVTLWAGVAPRLGELRRLDGADKHLVRSVRGLIRGRERAPESYTAVVIPETLHGKRWFQFLAHREALLLKGSLLFQPGVVVTDVPFVPELEELRGGRALEPERSVVLIPVSGVHDATVRAVSYASSLHPAAIQAMFFVTDPEEVGPVIEAWHERELGIPLVITEAPFRDIDRPLLDEVRAQTARGDTVVTVVLPELVPRHWWENLLHNQTAFALKRMLLFEPGVVVTSVPFHLREPEAPDGEAVAAPAPRPGT
jgi:amino acid transporter